MVYTLRRTWREREGAESRERRSEAEGGETFAEAERRARTWWSGVAWTTGTVPASAVVEILDAGGRLVASVRDGGDNAPVLAMAGSEDPALVRWRSHLREAGLLAERVSGSAERLADMGTRALAGEEGREVLDACAFRVTALAYRIDGMMHRGLSSLGGEPGDRADLRASVEALLDGAGLDRHLEESTDGRIQIPPSTLPDEALPGRASALIALADALLRACRAIEAHAAGAGPEAEAGPAPGR